MKPEEIYQVLTAQFGEAVLGFDTELAGDPNIRIASSAIADVCQYLAETDTLAFDSLMCLSGVDLSAKDEELAIVYHIYAMQHRHSVVLKTTVPKTDPHLPSVSQIWKTADWHEREAYDLYGIFFEGHSNLHRILLPDDWEGYPLRKDYKEPEFYRGMRVPYQVRDIEFSSCVARSGNITLFNFFATDIERRMPRNLGRVLVCGHECGACNVTRV